VVQANDPQLRDTLTALASVIRSIKRCGPTSLEQGALAALWTVHRLGGARLSDVARELGLDISTVSRHVAHLERTGYVVRTEDPADGRASLLKATETADAIFEQAFQARAEVIGAAVEGWPAQDVARLHELIQRLADGLGPWRTDETTKKIVSVP
jgi:DNA-binding MarR family transcriptional regulator